MRLIIPLALLMLTACDVDNDPANDKVTVQYDRERIKKSARTAKEVASGAARVAKTTGTAIKREVGDLDVDVDVRRTPTADPTP